MKRLFVLTLLFLTACTPAVAISVPTPTSTSIPTNSPAPTRTPIPTQLPTATQLIEESHDPPITPTESGEEVNPPELTPTPVAALSGSGDDVVEVDLPDDFVGVIHVIGNEIGEGFMVRNFDTNGELIGILVDTSDPYDGIRPLDFLNTEDTGSLEITGVGEWEVEIIEIFDAPFLDMPGNLTQSGDYVLVLGGGLPDSALVKKEEAIGNFRILGYGRSIEVLVDSTGSLDGVFSINPDIVVLEIQAQGEWTLDVLPR